MAGCSRSGGSFGVAPRSLSPAHRGQSVVTDENAAQKSPNESATCSYDGPSSPDRSLLQRTTCASPEPQSKHRASLFASTANGRSAPRRFSKADQKRLAEARSELAAVKRALHRLPRRHRSVLAALRIEDATREEVATRFDLTLRRVDTVLRQALDHCAELAGRSVQGGVRRGRNADATRASSAAIR